MEGPKGSSRARRQGKPKSYTFTGCWTCRSRKVKCDERQTNGCGVCERSALQCAGYGVNLCWITGKRSGLHGLRRRHIKPIHPFAPGIPDDEVNRMLVALDKIAAPSKTASMGPFGVFHTEAHADKDSNGGDHMSHSNCSWEFADAQHNSKESSQSREANQLYSQHWGPLVQRSSFSPNERDYIDIVGCFESQVQGQAAPSDYHQIMPSEVNSNVCVIPSLQLVEQASLDMDPLLPSQDAEILPICHPDLIRSSCFSLHLELSMPLFQNPETSMLMYHYMNHVAELLQPVLHPRNPWRTTYFPFALNGCPEFFLVQSATPPLGVSIALFHSILSSAAFHLRNVRRGSTRFHRLGLQHRARALHSLNTALARPIDTQLYTVYLTAMLSLVTIDTMTGEDSDFKIHLRGCRQLKRPLADSRAIDDSKMQVTSIYHFLTLLARTTSNELEPRACSIDKLSFETPYFNSNDREIEYIYGITPTLGNLLQRTCQLAECLSFYHRREAPEFVIQVRENLKDELRRWSIDSEKSYLFGSEETMLEIARCQARAFHSAVLIFYCRTVQPDSQIDLETEVCSVWENLTTAEDLKDLYMGGEKRAAPMSWPAFIAACEASYRTPWVEWWTRVQGYWVGNFTRQWMVVQELWAIMDKDESVFSWRDALKRSGRLVLPI